VTQRGPTCVCATATSRDLVLTCALYAGDAVLLAVNFEPGQRGGVGRRVSEGEIMRLCGWRTHAMFDRYNVIDEADLAAAVGRRFAAPNGKGATKSGLLTVPLSR
jgi:hypothetical protein